MSTRTSSNKRKAGDVAGDVSNMRALKIDPIQDSGDPEFIEFVNNQDKMRAYINTTDYRGKYGFLELNYTGFPKKSADKNITTKRVGIVDRINSYIKSISSDSKRPRSEPERTLSTYVIPKDGTGIELRDVYMENVRGNKIISGFGFTDEQNELYSQYTWYFCFRGLVTLDMIHDFTGSRVKKVPIEEKNFNANYKKIVIGQTINELYYLAQKLFPGITDISIFEEFLRKIIFPKWEDNKNNSPGNIGNIDWWIYTFFFIDDKNDINEVAFAILLKCGILKTNVYQQNLINNFIGVMTLDLPKYIQSNYQDPKPSVMEPIFTCDTTSQPTKFQYTLPFINLLNHSGVGKYHTSISNIYDAGAKYSNFINEFEKRIKIDETDNVKYNIYFTFGNNYVHHFMSMEYNIGNKDKTTADLSITYFPLLNVKPITIKGPLDSTVVSISQKINKVVNDPEQVIYLSLFKFMGDFGKVLYDYRLMKNSKNIIMHAVSDIMGAFISGMFLPGTVFASSSSARDAGTTEQEFYFKRAFTEKDEQIDFTFDYKVRAGEHGLSFGTKQLKKDIKFLKSIKINKCKC